MHRHLSKFKNKKTLIAVLACLGIILTTVGVTVAWFTYSRTGVKENSISSGKITFIYQENEEVGNGILLTDAMPMPDSYGKTQENKFDFKVTSTTGVAKIPYEITLRKTDNSDDIGNSVKVYLTKVDGTNEEEKVLSMYSNLANSTNAIAMVNGEKTLYKTEIPAGSENYTDNYRLRIWLNDNPSDGNVLSYQQTVTQECSDTNYTTKETCEGAGEKWLDKATPAAAKNFTIKVNVYAEGEAATQEEIAGADSTSISNISIGNTNATENTDTTKNYNYEITTMSSNVEINVETSNPNATASVTSYNPTAMNSKVRRLSTSSEQPLTNGDNYFKITVTSANKKKNKDYILKVVKTVSTDATLKSLSFDGCTLNETFNKNTISYTCDASSSNITFTGKATESSSTITVTNNNAVTECGTDVTVKVTAESGATKTYTVKATYQGSISYTSVSGDSILSILKNNDLSEGYYKFKINGKTEEYKVHLYTFNGDQEWTTDHTFGDAGDVANSCGGMAKNMVAVKVNGNLINSAKVQPYYTNYGGPKGFTLYVTGTLTNTGTIDNSHGAYAYGEDVYLWKNADGTYEKVPALGGLGGLTPEVGTFSAGTDGTGRQTGGGASGYRHNNQSPMDRGGNGTSYSGGAGGGSAYSQDIGYKGDDNGGAGGKGIYGGAGNPGGAGSWADVWGSNGTGGLLIVYTNIFTNSGILSANGSNGGPTGGGSGGGSINIFTNTITTRGTISANRGIASNNNDGKAGMGTISIGSIATGTYVAN